MREDCVQAVEDALGRPLRAGEARDIENQVSLQMRLLARKDPQGWSGMSSLGRLQAGADAAAKAIIADLKLKQERVRLQIAAHDRIENQLAEAFDQLPEKAKPGQMLRVVSQLLAFDPKARGIASAETWSHAITNEAMGRLMPLWNSVKGFAHLFENEQGVRDLVHELFGEDSGNAAAKAGAQAWIQVTDELRDRANAAGMDIGQLEDWHYPQSHSQARIAAAAKDPNEALEKWTADTLPLLDRDKYLRADGSRMGDDEVRNFLRNAWDTIITDGHNKQAPGKPIYGGGIANRKSASRQIFFKDADAYLTYQGLYGDRSLWSTLTGHIRSISRDIGLLETLGPKPDDTFRYFNERTRLDEQRQFPAAKSKVTKQFAFNEALFDYVAGKRQVVNDKVAAAGQAFRNFETATKLGRVAITALGDEAGMSATAFANKVPWSEAFMRELTYLNPANAGEREIAAHAGLGINGIIGGLNRFGQEDLQLSGGEGRAAGVRNFTSKLATGVLQASGAEAMWDARRRGLGSVLMSYLGKTTREVEHFADINAQDHGVLSTKGVTESDWQLWKRADLEDWGLRHGVLTPKAIAAIPDAEVEEVIAPQLEQIRTHAQEQLDALQAKNEADRAKVAERTQGLQSWLADQQARLQKLSSSSKATRQITALNEQLGQLSQRIDLAKAFWQEAVKPTSIVREVGSADTGRQIGKSNLRRAGVAEGQAAEAAKGIRAQLREVSRAFENAKADLKGDIEEGFADKQKELAEYSDQVEQLVGRREAVQARIQGDVEPQIAAAREAARRHASTMLLGHVLEETGMGVMDTGARERASMLFGTTPGTVAGELTRSALLFKSFSVSMMMKHWARAAAMPGGGATASYVARLVVAGTIMGAVATQLRNLVSGKDPANVAEPQFWGESMLRGGGLGFYGDFLYDELTSHDTSLVPALMGPLATSSEEVWNLTGAAAFKHAKGQRVDEGANLVRFLRGNVPFLNMWYTQAALDHLVWNEMQESASPGYLERMQNKAYAQRGSTWWWEPGDNQPSRGPDFAQMFQPERGRAQMQAIAARLEQETGDQ